MDHAHLWTTCLMDARHTPFRTKKCWNAAATNILNASSQPILPPESTTLHSITTSHPPSINYPKLGSNPTTARLPSNEAVEIDQPTTHHEHSGPKDSQACSDAYSYQSAVPLKKGISTSIEFGEEKGYWLVE